MMMMISKVIILSTFFFEWNSFFFNKFKNVENIYIPLNIFVLMM